MAKKYTYDFPRPAVTVDILLVTREETPRVLLIQRKNNPFQGMWALPGGFVDMDETLEESARRELLEETGLSVKRLEQLGTFGDPGRDPRGRVVSVVYLAEVNASRLKPQAADDAQDAKWYPLHRLPKLAFDHREILKLARKRLNQK